MPSLADLMSASAPRVLNALPNLGGNLKGAAQYAKAAVITEAQNAVNGAVRGAINTAMSSIFGTPSSPNMSVVVSRLSAPRPRPLVALWVGRLRPWWKVTRWLA